MPLFPHAPGSRTESTTTLVASGCSQEAVSDSTSQPAPATLDSKMIADPNARESSSLPAALAAAIYAPPPPERNPPRPYMHPCGLRPTVTFRIGTFADRDAIALVGSRAFWNEDFHGRVMHPFRAAYPDRLMAWWRRMTRLTLLQREKIMYIVAETDCEPESTWQSDPSSALHSGASVLGFQTKDRAGRSGREANSKHSSGSDSDSDSGSDGPSDDDANACVVEVRPPPVRRIVGFAEITPIGKRPQNPTEQSYFHHRPVPFSLSALIVAFIFIPLVKLYNYLEVVLFPNLAADPAKAHLAQATNDAIEYYTAPHPPKNPHFHESFIYLSLLAVHPNFQKKYGIGSLLVGMAKEVAKREKLPLGLACASGTVQFYIRNGVAKQFGNITEDIENTPLAEIAGGEMMFTE